MKQIRSLVVAMLSIGVMLVALRSAAGIAEAPLPDNALGVTNASPYWIYIWHGGKRWEQKSEKAQFATGFAIPPGKKVLFLNCATGPTARTTFEFRAMKTIRVGCIRTQSQVGIKKLSFTLGTNAPGSQTALSAKDFR